MGGSCSAYTERRGLNSVLLVTPERKKPSWRPRRRWEDNNMMDLQELGCGVMDWIELALFRNRCRAILNEVMKLWVP
jgi:hypothetical protein